MGVQCRGQINIFVYISGNGMANIFYMAYDECLRFLFRCKDHNHSFLLKYPKNNPENSDTVDFSWFLNLNLGKEITKPWVQNLY